MESNPLNDKDSKGKTVKKVREKFLENLSKRPFELEIYEYVSKNLHWEGKGVCFRKGETTPIKFHLIHIPLFSMKKWAQILKIKKPIKKNLVKSIESIVQNPEEVGKEKEKLKKVVLEFVGNNNQAKGKPNDNDHLKFGLDKTYHSVDKRVKFTLKQFVPGKGKATDKGKSTDILKGDKPYESFFEFRKEIPESLWEKSPNDPDFHTCQPRSSLVIKFEKKKKYIEFYERSEQNRKNK